MKTAIMQPYFFPYIGYFQLIKNSDLWVVFDKIQYIRHGWINRNRILKNNFLEEQYIIVPLKKHSQNDLINDIEVINTDEWKQKILAQLSHYKKRADFYKETTELVEKTLFGKYKTISELNILGLKNTCEYLSIPFNKKIFSEMELGIDSVGAPDEWALEISKALKATTYINPHGGIELFDQEKYLKNNIEIKFLKPILNPYIQKNHGNFLEGLSIIDVMMFNSPEQINDLLDMYEWIK